jgi:hypothetical protein
MDTIAIDRPTESGLPIDSQGDSQPGGRWQPTVDGHTLGGNHFVHLIGTQAGVQ